MSDFRDEKNSKERSLSDVATQESHDVLSVSKQ